MEGNRDESEKCISIAQKCINAGAYEKALKFLNKAERLYPTQKAKDLLDHVKKLNESTPDDTGGGAEKNDDGVCHRKGSHSREATDSKQTSEPKEKDYTEEQLTAVKRIKKCKDYYEILCVEKDASEADLKKAYRKLALQMHPDKNKAPGATEAFKAVGNAFAVINDPAKRKKYDMFGPEEEQRSTRSQREYDYSHGFEGDISPEELFNMFFGGGFPSGSVYQRRGRHSHSRQHYRFTSRESQSSNDGSATLLLQLAPILLLVILSLLSSFFVSDPVFSLNRTDKYSAQRKTQHLHIPYYVKQDFTSNFAGDLRRIERQVEEEFISNLRQNCWRERSYKENMLWRARNYADAKLYERAQNMETPSCDQLQKIYS
ncbi:dnaJ homolog subfamily B member 12-like isoform X1 [Ruditapes philippinarum]|uniref:dnaJ homolog subfamily B member 12-like isoform X1 n=1 Tax=Ruditapes philippinarum TaxID=129788 RepID=UPI00295AFE84|nr:dnaJ homolog subfamily B member 12-like isoform X1 [Ruditapes philippinarum]